MLWARVLLGGLGTLFIAAGALWSWLTLNERHRPHPQQPAVFGVLLVGAAAYVVVGVLFVVAAVARNEWLYAAGGAVLVVRFLAFRFIARRKGVEA